MVTSVNPQVHDERWSAIVASWFWTSSSVLQGAILIVLAWLLPAPALADTPQIIQHLSTVANPAASGGPNSYTYQINIAPTGSGDTMILSITALYGHGTPRVTDSASDPSPTAICDAADGSGNYISYIYAFQPSAGVRWLKVTFSTPFIPFDWEVTEFNHLGATSQGSECQAGLPSTSGTVTPRSFTPTNNNSTGGNLIYNYTALATAAGCNAESYTPATGFTLLNGDVSSWINGDGFGFQKSAQYEVQTADASVTASMAMGGETCSGGNGDPFNSLTIALKVGSSGVSNPSTIHVVRAIQLTSTNFGSPTLPTAFTVPTPTVGNLRVFMFESDNTGGYNLANSVTSSDGCKYTEINLTSTTQGGTIWYAQNCSPCPKCTATFYNRSGQAFANTAGQFYDIENANASSYQKYTSTSLGCSSSTSTANNPSFTPSNSAGLVLAMLADGNGPTIALTSPSGAVYTCPAYTNQNDGDFMCSGDGHGFYYYSSDAAQNWTWTITSEASNTCIGAAAAFK